MIKVSQYGRLKARIKWNLWTRWKLPREVYLSADPSIILKCRNLQTGNVVVNSQKNYGMEDCALVYEPQETELFRNTIGNSSVFYDIGAHIGHFSLIAASMQNVKQVIAFEILDSFADEILFHAQENQLPNIKVERMAIGGRNQRIAFGNLADISCKTSIVLDDYVENNPPAPDFIKMDIEGFECFAVEGAKNTLRNHTPDFLLSIHPEYISNHGGNIERIYRVLREIYSYIYLLENNKQTTSNLIRREVVSLDDFPRNNFTVYCSSKRYESS